MKRTGLFIAATLAAAAFLAPGAVDEGENYRCEDCNVVLISVDTLRADHLGTYGYDRNTSPNIDRLAGDGIVFENVYAQSSHTMTSHFSMFTGMYPRTHGVRPGAPEKRGFSERFTLLAEVLNRSGYRTLSYNGGANVRGGLGFERGFDVYRDEYVRQSMNPRGNLDNATEIVDRQISNGSEPFFMFLHTYKVHDPYHPPEKYMDMFPGFNRTIREKSIQRLREMQRNESLRKPDGHFRWQYVAPRMRNSTEWKRHMVSGYDADIRYTDHVIGEVIRMLEEKGIRDETVIIVTSDHGEQFGEHGSWYHGMLYNEEIHVPLIIDIPGVEGDRESEMAAVVDIAPTILDIVGVTHEGFAEQQQGSSLLQVMRGGEREGDFIAASHFTNQTALIDTERGLKYYDSDFRVNYRDTGFYRGEGFERLYRFEDGEWNRIKNATLLEELARLNDEVGRDDARIEKRLEEIGYLQ